jgi:tetratricopeptide (TPR) repeat protein
MSFLADSQLHTIEEYKKKWMYDEAISYINAFLVKEPTNEELLLQIADLQYKKWEIDRATKAIDFLNTQTNNEDPMGLYVKWVLEMEKNNRKDARWYLQKAMHTIGKDNHEIMRCYGLCEYWYGNREKWIHYLENAYTINRYDAEIIYNLIELYLLEHRYKKAKDLIQFFHENKDELEMYDKKESFYRNKIKLFTAYLDVYEKRKVQKGNAK